jgi:hypothetical protein
MTDNNKSAWPDLSFLKNFSLKDFAYLLFIAVILAGGFLIWRKSEKINLLEEKIASMKPDTVFVQGEVIHDSLWQVKIKYDTTQIITAHFDTLYFVDIDTSPAPCKGIILLVDRQKLFDLRARVEYPTGKAEFIYNYKTQPDKWIWDVGLGMSNEWKPFAVSTIGKGTYGLGGLLASDRWGLFVRRKF